MVSCLSNLRCRLLYAQALGGSRRQASVEVFRVGQGTRPQPSGREHRSNATRAAMIFASVGGASRRREPLPGTTGACQVGWHECPRSGARPRWSVIRPRCATTSDLRQDPRRCKPALHQGDHTHLDGFWSQMRCQGVVLLASRISVPSPAMPCTLITPSGAPHSLISRICFLSFAGANAGACLRMVMPSHLSTLHLGFAVSKPTSNQQFHTKTRLAAAHQRPLILTALAKPLECGDGHEDELCRHQG